MTPDTPDTPDHPMPEKEVEVNPGTEREEINLDPYREAGSEKEKK